MKSMLLVILMGALCVQNLQGQQELSLQSPSVFAVASIRSSDPHNRSFRLDLSGDGLKAAGVTIVDLVSEAYGIYEVDRIIGMPNWAMKERFDINAKVETGNPETDNKAEIKVRRAMLQRLLDERFGLRAEVQKREGSVYFLDRADAGIKLVASTKMPEQKGGIKGVNAVITKSGPGVLEGHDISLKNLAQDLSSSAGKVILDRSNVQGVYDIALHWSTLSATEATSGDLSGSPTLFTALREQLGLRLVSGKAPIDVVVIEQIHLPTAN